MTMNPANCSRRAAGARRVLLAALLCGASLAGATAMPSAADAQARQHAVANALALAAQVQARVADYRQRNNAFPSSNAEAQVNPPTVIATADVKSITVRGEGVVEVALTQTSGVEDGVIVLTPQIAKTADDGHVEWRCASASYATIADMTGGQCEYSKLP